MKILSRQLLSRLNYITDLIGGAYIIALPYLTWDKSSLY